MLEKQFEGFHPGFSGVLHVIEFIALLKLKLSETRAVGPAGVQPR